MTLPRTVSVLFVDDTKNAYRGMPRVDLWGYRRNAMLYDSSNPIVAHPPCGPWSKLRHLYLGKEHECAPFAVAQVRRLGGVLEHPAGSLLWKEMDLPEVGASQDSFGGYALEVDQVAWGHVARKKTWLYIVGVPFRVVEQGLRTGGTPTHWCSGFRTGGGRKYPANYKQRGCAVPEGIKVCSAQQRRRTPRAFAEWLVELARQAHVGN